MKANTYMAETEPSKGFEFFTEHDVEFPQGPSSERKGLSERGRRARHVALVVVFGEAVAIKADTIGDTCGNLPLTPRSA